MFGSHLSIAGSLNNALDEAVKLNLDTVQIFTKNQQQWKAKPLSDNAIKAWRDRTAELGWQARTVSHASYLINLASPNDELWEKSVNLMQDEIERCEALGIPFLVHHPGAYTTSTLEQGIERIAKAYKELFKRTKGMTVVSCLENTVGGGSSIGREFHEIARLRDRILDSTGLPARIGVCIDTCHAHAGGYDLSTPTRAAQALETLEAKLGSEWVKVLHLNDSKGAAGSRLDRHEHIGKGTIGLPGFTAFVNYRPFADKPKIMETPKGVDGDDTPLDEMNLSTLRSLMKQDVKSPKQGDSKKSVKRGK